MANEENSIGQSESLIPVCDCCGKSFTKGQTIEAIGLLVPLDGDKYRVEVRICIPCGTRVDRSDTAAEQAILKSAVGRLMLACHGEDSGAAH